MALTTSELAQWVEKELGHDISAAASSQRDDIITQLDVSHKTILSGGGLLNYDADGRRVRSDTLFSFARALNPKILNLVAPVNSTSTGRTASATLGSTSLALTGHPGAGVSLANYYIKVGTAPEVYRISAHTAGSSTITLDGAWVGDSVTGSSWEAFRLQYNVGASDILQLLSPLRCYGYGSGGRIDVVDKNELLTQFPMTQVGKGFPKLAAIIRESAGTITLQLNGYPESAARCELEYIPMPSTLDEVSVNPIIPDHFRLVLGHLAAYYMLVRNDDDRAGSHLMMARDKFAEMVQWNEKMFSSGDSDYGRVVLNCGFGRQAVPLLPKVAG